MDDLIRRKDAILEIQAHGVGSFDFEEDDWAPAQAERYVISRLNKIPAVDAVEVVRCGECRYMQPDGRCADFADDRIYPAASDFCSYGQRREEAGA